MERHELTDKLLKNHNSFIEYITSLTDIDFLHAQNEKWSAGQQLDHIFLSVKPLKQILGFRKILIRILFGKANRPSKSYDELSVKYKDKLQKGGRATGRFIPKKIGISQKTELVNSLTKAIQKLSNQIGSFSEQQLDDLILPHPLLGKITLREMIYFTIYHVAHHHEITRRNFKK